MHFFHSITFFGSVLFLDPNRPKSPGKHTVHDKMLDRVIETEERTENKGEIAETDTPTVKRFTCLHIYSE